MELLYVPFLWIIIIVLVGNCGCTKKSPIVEDGKYEYVLSSHCKYRCDYKAACGYNLVTGNYRCVCSRGYYGTGDVQGCRECPPNTYGDRIGLVDKCTPCPSNSGTKHITYPAGDVNKCKCNVGYRRVIRNHQHSCEPIPCAYPPHVESAKMINVELCQNAKVNDKCYYKCMDGYEVVYGSRDFVQCTGIGVWDLPLPKCRLIQCHADWIGAQDRKRFVVLCDIGNLITSSSNQYFTAGTKCQFSCKDGFYQKSGMDSIECLNSGKWNAMPIQCEERKCPLIARSSSFIQTINGRCFEEKSRVGEICKFQCSPGYMLIDDSPSLVNCLPGKTKFDPVGQWSFDVIENIPKCQDVERPRFASQDKCDHGIVIVKETEPDQSYAFVTFDKIDVTDNSGEAITVECVSENDQPCKYEMGKQYKIGITRRSGLYISFKATDMEGNYQFCRFRVTVTDNQPPKVSGCPKNIVIETEKKEEIVLWEQPKFVDNCEEGMTECITIASNYAPGAIFSTNKNFVIHYRAVDISNNENKECSFTIELIQKVKLCPNLNAPVNGVLMDFNGILAKMYCQRGYYTDGPVSFFYVCVHEHGHGPLQWKDGIRKTAVSKLPDCLKKIPEDPLASIHPTMSGNCNDPAVESQMKLQFAVFTGTDQSKVRYRCGTSKVVI